MSESFEFNVRITGQAGQGIETIGEALARLFKDSGYHLFTIRDYMSRIRGGNNFVQLRVSDSVVRSPRRICDVIVCLDGKSPPLHLPALAPEGVLFADFAKFGVDPGDTRCIDFPFYELSEQAGGSALYVNAAVLAALAAVTGCALSAVESVLGAAFRHKGEEIIAKNLVVARSAYDRALGLRGRLARFRFAASAAFSGSKPLFMNGHDAVTLGAVKAGCKFYAGYPMTPSTSILEAMAGYAPRYSIAVEQAEDEIAAINMAVGASFAGVRAMTATSGGGFSLMTEGLSLAAMTETPVVIVVGQRPGPATGFPTRTAQDCLNFVLHAGHGEFCRAVYAPGTIEQGFYLAQKAFNTAEKYQIPVIILTDTYFADSYTDIPSLDGVGEPVQRFIISRSDKAVDYVRYQITDSGVSPRALPSWIDGVMYADSDEHTEAGHITEDAVMGQRMVEKRVYHKFEMLSREIEKPRWENLETAEIILVGFGSTYGVMKDFCERVDDRSIGFVHLAQVWPFPSKEMMRLLGEDKTVLTIENNAEAQLAQLLFRETGIEAEGSVLKYDGRPFTIDEVAEVLRRQISVRVPIKTGDVP